VAERTRARAASAVVVLLLLSGCAAGRDAVDQQSGGQYRFVAGTGRSTVIPVDRRGAAPEVTGELLDGSAFQLPTLRGEVVVLNFWGSWCAPCRAEAPELRRVAEETRTLGVRFVGVNVKDDRQAAVAFERNFRIPYPSMYDPAGRVAVRFRDYPPNAIPSTIVLDRRGRVAAVFLRPLLREDLLPLVRQVAGEPA
jgi:thiol-disulfide isomerase/thioredoxin